MQHVPPKCVLFLKPIVTHISTMLGSYRPSQSLIGGAASEFGFCTVHLLLIDVRFVAQESEGKVLAPSIEDILLMGCSAYRL